MGKQTKKKAAKDETKSTSLNGEILSPGDVVSDAQDEILTADEKILFGLDVYPGRVATPDILLSLPTYIFSSKTPVKGDIQVDDVKHKGVYIIADTPGAKIWVEPPKIEMTTSNDGGKTKNIVLLPNPQHKVPFFHVLSKIQQAKGDDGTIINSYKFTAYNVINELGLSPGGKGYEQVRQMVEIFQRTYFWFKDPKGNKKLRSISGNFLTSHGELKGNEAKEYKKEYMIRVNSDLLREIAASENALWYLMYTDLRQLTQSPLAFRLYEYMVAAFSKRRYAVTHTFEEWLTVLDSPKTRKPVHVFRLLKSHIDKINTRCSGIQLEIIPENEKSKKLITIRMARPAEPLPAEPPTDFQTAIEALPANLKTMKPFLERMYSIYLESGPFACENIVHRFTQVLISVPKEETKDPFKCMDLFGKCMKHGFAYTLEQCRYVEQMQKSNSRRGRKIEHPIAYINDSIEKDYPKYNERLAFAESLMESGSLSDIGPDQLALYMTEERQKQRTAEIINYAMKCLSRKPEYRDTLFTKARKKLTSEWFIRMMSEQPDKYDFELEREVAHLVCEYASNNYLPRIEGDIRKNLLEAAHFLLDAREKRIYFAPTGRGGEKDNARLLSRVAFFWFGDLSHNWAFNVPENGDPDKLEADPGERKKAGKAKSEIKTEITTNKTLLEEAETVFSMFVDEYLASLKEEEKKSLSPSGDNKKLRAQAAIQLTTRFYNNEMSPEQKQDYVEGEHPKTVLYLEPKAYEIWAERKGGIENMKKYMAIRPTLMRIAYLMIRCSLPDNSDGQLTLFS